MCVCVIEYICVCVVGIICPSAVLNIKTQCVCVSCVSLCDLGSLFLTKDQKGFLYSVLLRLLRSLVSRVLFFFLKYLFEIKNEKSNPFI